MLIVYLLSAFGIAHFIKESDIANSFRIFLIKIHPIFVPLLQCYFCLGFWVSMIVYLLTFYRYNFIDHILWGFAGATISFAISSVIFFFHEVAGKNKSSIF